jgi:hypothetical protein
MHQYHAFQLNIHSELAFPELLKQADVHAMTASDKVVIQFGPVSSSGLMKAKVSGLFYQAGLNQLWLNIPNVARFLIADGASITIEPYSDVDEASIRLFVLGSCLGALLMQRDLFLLHGNAVKVGEHCVSFVGASGAGKSTLSGAFFKRGYSILADDVCAIDETNQVIPSFPQIKLWCDAAKQLDISTQALRQIRPFIEKFAVPLGQQFHQTSLPLKVVYILHTHNKDEFILKDVSGMRKLQPLRNNTYRQQYLEGLSKNKLHFGQCGRIASQVALVSVTRPNHGFKLNELVDAIEVDLVARGLLCA